MQSPSLLKYAAELISAIIQDYHNLPLLTFLYTDGGPNHRTTYLSVQLTLTSVFLILYLDFMCACWTALVQWWKIQ